MTVFFDEIEAAYFDDLFRRRTSAVTPERRQVVFRNGSEPQPHDCHANAARWAAEMAGVVPVPGWLIEAEGDDQLRLAAHSIVRDASGRLLDITPMEPSGLRFLIHEGTSDAFFGKLPHCNQVA